VGQRERLGRLQRRRAALARGINRGYLDGKMTAYINWPVIAAITPNIPYPPWASRSPPSRGRAPTRRQERLGDGADHAVHRARLAVPRLGSAATSAATAPTAATSRCKSPNGRDYSTIIETMDATAAQTVHFTVTGGLSTGAVHVWSTNVNSNNPADYFVHTRRHARRRRFR
jgi:hypothetical protein